MPVNSTTVSCCGGHASLDSADNATHGALVVVRSPGLLAAPFALGYNLNTQQPALLGAHGMKSGRYDSASPPLQLQHINAAAALAIQQLMLSALC